MLNEARYGRYDEDGNIFDEAEEPDADERDQHLDGAQDANEPMPVGEGESEDDEPDLEAIALRQAERYRCTVDTIRALRQLLRLFTLSQGQE